MTKEPTTVLDWLELGYERLKDPSKWIKGRFQVGDRYCLLGACGDHMAISMDVREALYTSAKRLYPLQMAFSSLVTFHDADSTTHDMIMHVLQAAIWAEGGRKFEPRS